MSTRAWLRFLALIGLAATLRFALGSGGSLAREAEPSPSFVRATSNPPGAVGTSSCSARACHGSLAPVGDDLVRRDEYTKWLVTDKHAQAYLVLFEERSRAIAKNLGLKAPHTAEQCLACHQYPSAPALVDRRHLDEETCFGIGCEACHGGAKDWLESHTRKLTVAEKAKQGMTDVGQPAQLAERCVGCHVGSPAAPGFSVVRDVNHDLIAAGHPRLNFEFAAFLSNLPPHWNAEKKIPAPAASARAWAVGQAITTKAALELLAHRASQAKAGPKQAPWPEFAEYDCFSCHHDLQAKSWRQEAAYATRPPGSLTWSTWYYAMPRMLAEPVYADAPALLHALDELDRLLRMPYPNSALVAEAARKAISRIDTPLLERLASVRYDARSLALAYRKDLENVQRAAAKGNWDAVSQLYLAVAALEDGKQEQKLGSVIRELLAKLAFSTAKGPAEKYDSPRDYQPKLIHEILKPVDSRQ
jgi:hypothetical protein